MFDGQLRRLEAGGTVLGLFPNASNNADSFELPRGAVLAIFTDGVTEAVNDKDEEFGEDRLCAVLQSNWNRPASEIRDEVLSQVHSFLGAEQPEDDLTLLVARVKQTAQNVSRS